MSIKRKPFHKHKSHQTKSNYPKSTNRADHENLENVLLFLLYQAKKPVASATIIHTLGQKNIKEKKIKKTIASLCEQKLVHQDGKRRLSLNKNGPFYAGILTQHPKGFGFVGQTKSINNTPPPKRDPFIAPSRMASAHHGDSVLIRVLRTRQDDRPEASIIEVLSRGQDTITGTYVADKRGGRVYPEDQGYPFTVAISSPGDLRPDSGDIVIVRYKREQKPTRVLQGTLLEVVGSPDDINTQMRIIIEKFNLPHEFSAAVQLETEALAENFKPEISREDLRETDHITIDGETAKDFDDAICVIKTRKGFRLFVSIADVSYFVQPDTAIDKEAYSRGTSIYFPGRVIPMLPEKLSNDLCSLVPDQDRFTLTARLDFDRSGALLKKQFSRSVIRSKQRFTYTTVRQILIDKDPEIRRRHKPFLIQLKWAEELATALKEKRRQRGSIDFTISEAEFVLNRAGEVDSIRKTERNFAHYMIEEFMIVANEAVAAQFAEKSLPVLYRVHEPPAQEKTANFLTFVQSLNLTTEPFDNSPGWYARLLISCRQTKYNYIVNNLLLRAMKQAHYSGKNAGHFGLASPEYTHFTSPIRRYPDLSVHRQLIRLLDKQSSIKEIKSQSPDMEKDGVVLSARERTAVNAEREMNDRLKLNYMKNLIGKSFTAVISGVNDNVLFVEIQDLCISGSIAVEYLDDDYYMFDEKRYRLIGEISGKTYQVGDILEVLLVDIDRLKRRIHFAPLQNNGSND